MMKMGYMFLVTAAAAAALEISCSMDQYALSVGVVFFYDDAALCEKTCARCPSLRCGPAEDGWTNLTKCHAAREAPPPATRSVDVPCDAVALGRVRFSLSSNATNDDVTDDEERVSQSPTWCPKRIPERVGSVSAAALPVGPRSPAFGARRGRTPTA